jgi:hypothetical protein
LNFTLTFCNLQLSIFFWKIHDFYFLENNVFSESEKKS